MTIGLGIRRNPEESWLDCALRSAEPFGVQHEVREDYERFRRVGQSEADAALHACMEWDLCLIVQDGENRK